MIKLLYCLLAIFITSVVIKFNYNPFLFDSEASNGISVSNIIYVPSFATSQFIVLSALIVASVIYLIEVQKN